MIEKEPGMNSTVVCHLLNHVSEGVLDQSCQPLALLECLLDRQATNWKKVERQLETVG